MSRYIHQWKKQMRQDGVNEDDLLEIKQDISSLRLPSRFIHFGIHFDDRRNKYTTTTYPLIFVT